MQMICGCGLSGHSSFLRIFFLSVKDLRGFQIFSVHHESPCLVFCRKSSQAKESLPIIFKSDVRQFDRDVRPRHITPGGLTQEGRYVFITESDPLCPTHNTVFVLFV